MLSSAAEHKVRGMFGLWWRTSNRTLFFSYPVRKKAVLGNFLGNPS